MVAMTGSSSPCNSSLVLLEPHGAQLVGLDDAMTVTEIVKHEICMSITTTAR